MADELGVELKGLKDVDDRLVFLGSVGGEKVMRSTLFAAAKPIRDEVVRSIAAIPHGSGALAKAVRRVYIRAAGGNTSRFVVSIAPKTKDRTAIALANLFYKRKKAIRGVYWGHLLEWGHRIATRRSGRISRSGRVHVSGAPHTGGKVAGRHIFGRALQAKAGEAVQLFTKRISAAVERAIQKLNPE